MENKVEIDEDLYVDYHNGWYKKDNIFFYVCDWQVPAKTELNALESLLKREKERPFSQYILFPWASLVDYLITNNEKKANKLINALNNHPPRTGVNVVTYCQHIYAMRLVKFFNKLRITEIYWSHKVRSLNEVDGIKLKPFNLYPVMYEKYKYLHKEGSKPIERTYLYSFIGSYQKSCYLSDIRNDIFNLESKSFNKIIQRANWHFDADVYKKQMLDVTLSQAEEELRLTQELEYVECMKNSVFSLCPSGSGPNSIRIWESLRFGSIPVIFSNDLHLPEEYTNRVIQLSEDKHSLNEFIEKIENNTVDSIIKYYGVKIG